LNLPKITQVRLKTTIHERALL